MVFLNRRLSIRKLSLPVSIGFYEVEKLHPQRVLIDVEVRLVPLTHDIPDDVRATVDYELIHKKIPALVANRHFNMQETLCHEILQFCAVLCRFGGRGKCSRVDTQAGHIRQLRERGL